MKKTRSRGQNKPLERKGVLRGEEYGKTLKGVAVCKQCRNVYYKKSWHSAEKSIPKTALSKEDARLVLCPACSMLAKGLYEGEVVVKGFPRAYEAELLHLIVNFGAKQEKKDPQDRIINVEKVRGGFRVTTTENQMAVRLAKKIKSSFRGSECKISYSDEPYEVSRITVEFLTHA